MNTTNFPKYTKPYVSNSARDPNAGRKAAVCGPREHKKHLVNSMQ